MLQRYRGYDNLSTGHQDVDVGGDPLPGPGPGPGPAPHHHLPPLHRGRPQALPPDRPRLQPLLRHGRDGEERTLDGEPGGPLPDGHRPDTVGEHLEDGPGQAAPSHRTTVTGLGLQQTRQDLAPLQLRH